MSRNTKIVIGIMAVGALFVAMLGYWSSMRRARQTEAATATVVGAEKETKSGKRGKDNTIVTVSYQADASPAQGRIRVSGVHLEDYPAGRSLRICYDPADPKSVRLNGGTCG